MLREFFLLCTNVCSSVVQRMTVKWFDWVLMISRKFQCSLLSVMKSMLFYDLLDENVHRKNISIPIYVY